MEGGSGPDEGGDLLFLQKVDEQGGEEKVLLGNDVGGGPTLEGEVDVFHRQVKVKGGLVAHDVVPGDLAGLRHPFDEVNDASMGDDDPLGGAGRARGKDGVHRVDVQHAPAPGSQEG